MRIPLQNGQRLVLASEANGARHIFEIKKLLGHGGSCLCYEAEEQTGGSDRHLGILKELCPADETYFTLEPLRDGRGYRSLIGDAEEYARMCAQYRDAHRLMEKVIADPSGKGALLQNDFPVVRFFRPDAEEAAGLYAWSDANFAGIGGDQVLRELREQSRAEPEKALTLVLGILKKLSEVVRKMHGAELYHLDIKPANFLVARSGDGSPDPARLLLFDINTIRREDVEWDDRRREPVGTPGYMDPLIRQNGLSFACDRYSIGATLFEALTGGLPESGPGFAANFAALVQDSPFVARSETNRDESVSGTLIEILKGTIGKDTSAQPRFAVMRQLIEKLTFAENAIAKLEGEAEVDQTGSTDPKVACQKVLYKHPLYACVPPGADRADVLVLGSGRYAQAFLDALLEIGQNGTELSAFCVCQEPEAEQGRYLAQRPLLESYVELNGRFADPFGLGRPLARLAFRPMAERDALLQVDLRQIFVCEGNSMQNRRRAEQLRAAGTAAQIFFATTTPPDPYMQLPENVWPIYVREKLTSADIAPALDRMALNLHLSWKGTRSLNLAEEEKAFYADPYNYASSIASALSIPYKLQSVGVIDPGAPFDLESAAEGVYTRVLLPAQNGDAEALRKYRRLIWYEHRRWIFEKIAQGYDVPRDGNGRYSLQACLAHAAVKDERRRLHPCLVPSTEEMPLCGAPWDKKSYWDSAEEESVARLDPLDRMSVELHRIFMEDRRRLLAQRPEGPLAHTAYSRLKSLLRDAPECVKQLFWEYTFTMKNVVKGIPASCKQLDSVQKRLLRACERELPSHQADFVKDRLQELQTDAFSLCESVLCRDYKRNDAAIVDTIPLILTLHKPIESMAMSLSLGQDWVEGIAAPTALCPGQLVFLCRFGPEHGAAAAVKRVRAAAAYFERRRAADSGLTFVVAVEGETGAAEQSRLTHDLQELSEACGSRVNCFVQRGPAAEVFARWLREHPVKLLDAALPVPDCGAARFSFDRETGRFRTEAEAWQHLRYIRDRSFLRAEDALALAGLEAAVETPDLSTEPEPLLRLYDRDPALWERMAQKLGRHAAASWTLPVCCRPAQEDAFVSAAFDGGIEALLTALQRRGILTAWDMTPCGAGTRVTITADAAAAHTLCDILEDEQSALRPGRWTLAEQGAGFVFTIPQSCVTGFGTETEAEREFLRALEKAGAVRRLRLGETAEFRFSGAAVQELLTCAGRLSEAACCRAARTSDRWDDMALLRMDRLPGGCLLLTRGFRVELVYIPAAAPTRVEVDRFAAAARQLGARQLARKDLS